MPLPTFIVIGIVKAGTTSLHHYLSQHPDIQMSQWVWPRFFHIDGAPPNFKLLAENFGTDRYLESEYRFNLMFPARIPRDIETYKKLWPNSINNQNYGEVSPTYLYDDTVPARIHKRLPNVKLIVILRHPVLRAYSHYLMDFRYGWEEIDDFAEALLEEPIEVDHFWWGKRHYIRHGFYVAPLQRYLQKFDKEQIKIYLYDEFQSSPQKMMKDMFHFLEIDTSFKVNMSIRHNKSMLHKDNFLTRQIKSNRQLKKQLLTLIPPKIIFFLRKQIIERSLIGPPPLKPEEYNQLIETFRDEILCLQDLLKRDLSSWLKKSF